jgi:Tol biopolymer transport system component/DNA-binding winged helix-turn-helix (wHTH) protein
LAQPAINPRIVRFGVFEADLVNAELRKHGLRVRIQEQPYQVLSALLERPGDVVSRDDLVRRLWPDGTFVDFDRGLNAAVTRLRQTLSDSAENPKYVETVARRGYRFLMPVDLLTQQNSTERLPPDALAAPNVNLTQSNAGLQKAQSGHRIARYGALLGLLAVVVGVLLLSWPRNSIPKAARSYTQITDFTDSAIAPTLSPDGRTVAFIRGADWFMSQGQIWLKALPNGESVRLTQDPRPKFAPTFSPDGSQIAYSVVDLSRTAWDTVAVPVAGGESRLLMRNAEGLTWIDRHQFLLSEIKTGFHMAVVTANENRSEARDVYVPGHERAMAHFSYASPDRKWVLIIEMDHTTAWQPCRLVPFDGSSPGRQVGPPGRCTSAGWSPDGQWMYFTIATPEGQHLWRQRLPQAVPEQLTFGPTEEQGVAVAPDGRSLITSMGMQQSAIWLHDSRGDRPISSEGIASLPRFSADGNRVFYLARRSAPDPANELWAVDFGTGRRERLVAGFQITSYDISVSGTEVLFAAKPSQGKSQVWLASPTRRSSPVLVASDGEDAPFFGPDGQILVRHSDGKANYLFRMNPDGSGRAKVVPYPISNVMSVSPDRLWAATLTPVNDTLANVAEMAIPIKGGAAKRICSGFCVAQWAPDGRFLYLTERAAGFHSEKKAVAIPVPAGKTLPELPVSGIESLEDGLAVSGSLMIDHWDFAPALDPSTYAYVRVAMHRNLFRISIP